MADTKKEYTSNLHPKGDLDTTVYPNVKSENIIDKDTTAYTAGKVPDSSLVSRSLDGLNEKIETNKIQTDTNKTNIAKNTQDIDLLKTNTIKKDTDASLKSLTLPSASDLKTKDGTSFGGGSKVYNGTEYLPTFDIATLKDTYVDINSDQTIVGTKKWENNTTENIGDIIIGKTNDTKPNNKIQIANNFYLVAAPVFDFASTYLLQMGSAYLRLDSSNKMNFHVDTSFTFEYSSNRTVKLVCDNKPLIYLDSKGIKIRDSYVVTETQLNAKQDKRFIHTVEIHYASNGSYFCFTGTSDKNTPIDSVQVLTTVFANRDLCGVGIFGSAGLSKIHVGSSVNDTTFKKYMNNGEYANPSEETFAMVFNTTGFTITDNVTAM